MSIAPPADLATIATAAHTALRAAAATENLDPSHCILATRVMIAVADAHGIALKPQTTEAVAFNRAAMELLLKGVPMDRWPDDAWSVGVTTHPGQPRGKGYRGHLVAVTADGWLIDINTEQFDRPHRGLHIPGGPLIMPVPDPWTSDNPAIATDSPDDDWTAIIQYRPGVSPDDYRTARDWRGKHGQRIAGDAIRALRAAA